MKSPMALIATSVLTVLASGAAKPAHAQWAENGLATFSTNPRSITYSGDINIQGTLGGALKVSTVAQPGVYTLASYSYTGQLLQFFTWSGSNPPTPNNTLELTTQELSKGGGGDYAYSISSGTGSTSGSIQYSSLAYSSPTGGAAATFPYTISFPNPSSTGTYVYGFAISAAVRTPAPNAISATALEYVGGITGQQ